MPEKFENNKQNLQEKIAELKNFPVVKEAFEVIPRMLKEKYPQMAESFPNVLPYHGEHHAETVLFEATGIALGEGVESSRDLELLAIASAFHDAGFAESYDNNEPFGAEIAARHMKEKGEYSNQEIERVKKIILSTKVKFDPEFIQQIQDENDLLCKIIADADVSSFGKECFFDDSENIFKELMGIGKIKSDTLEARRAVNSFREKMLRTHHWQTCSAGLMYDEQKQKNLEKLHESLNP